MKRKVQALAFGRERVTMKELIALTANQHRAPKDLVDFSKRLLAEVVLQAANGRVVDLRGFGAFRFAKRAARTVRNPVTKELMQLPETRYLSFRATRRRSA
jgi:DNA-binding protein HU-beta